LAGKKLAKIWKNFLEKLIKQFATKKNWQNLEIFSRKVDQTICQEKKIGKIWKNFLEKLIKQFATKKKLAKFGNFF